MEIIPAIDIIGGACVRLTQGDYDRKKVYNEDPLEVAKQFEDAGIERLHLVDLDGAKAKHIVNQKVLENIVNQTKLKVDFGGGLKTDEDLRIAFECGAQQVTGGSIAVKQPAVFESWLKTYGAERIILGADVRDGKVAISGWQEESALDLETLIDQFLPLDLRYVISTDIAKDGALAGPSFSLYEGMRQRYPDLRVIASGGVSTMDDLVQLRAQGCFGAIVGKAIYEGRVTLTELANFNR